MRRVLQEPRVVVIGGLIWCHSDSTVSLDTKSWTCPIQYGIAWRRLYKTFSNPQYECGGIQTTVGDRQIRHNYSAICRNNQSKVFLLHQLWKWDFNEDPNTLAVVAGGVVQIMAVPSLLLQSDIGWPYCWLQITLMVDQTREVLQEPSGSRKTRMRKWICANVE